MEGELMPPIALDPPGEPLEVRVALVSPRRKVLILLMAVQRARVKSAAVLTLDMRDLGLEGRVDDQGKKA